MNRMQPQDRLRQGGSALPVSVAPVYRFCATVLAGLTILAGTAGISQAGSGNARKSTGQVSSFSPSAGIRDPMNPDAYMRDLASRMDSTQSQRMLLDGGGGSRVGSAPRNQTTPGSSIPRVGSFAPAQAPQTPSPTAGASAVPIVPRSRPVETPAPSGSVSPPAPSAAPTPTPTSPAPTGVVVPQGVWTDPQLQGTPVVGTTEGTTAHVGPPVAPAGPIMLVTPGQTVRLPSAGPVESATPTIFSGPAGARSSPVYPARTGASTMPRGPGAIERALRADTRGLALWDEPKPLSPDGLQVPGPREPWALGSDLEKYRAYAVRQGSRYPVENLRKALERGGMALGAGANIFLLGYASDRTKPLRQNDGKGLLQEPGKVPARAGATLGHLADGLYSIIDLATLNSLPDPNKPVYTDNHPLVRPLIFTGRTIGGVWKTTEEVGNALTWGLFDNLTGSIGLFLGDVIELIKQAGQAVTNVARAPFHLASRNKKPEGTDRALDWVLLVPLELASNAVQMKGFSNMDDYNRAFADKGVIGSVLEFAGSTYIVYRAVDELRDRRRESRSNQNQSPNSNQQPGGQTPTTPEPPVVEPPVITDYYLILSSEGEITGWNFSEAWWNQGW